MNQDHLSKQTIRWILQNVGEGASIQSITRLKGSTSSLLHHVVVENDGTTKDLVIRQHNKEDWLRDEPDLVLHEVNSLNMAKDIKLETPEVIAFDETGDACGLPAILMTKVGGKVELKPKTMNQWLDGLAKALTSIHLKDGKEFGWTYFSYNDVNTVQVPEWTKVPNTWKRAIEIAKRPRPINEYCFIHRDYHPTNVLWENGVVNSVVDWVNACYGPKGVDVGHCRLNLALLYGVSTADKFLQSYKNFAGSTFHYDVYWDILSVIDTLFGSPEVYPGWIEFGVEGLTDELMEERLDQYVISLMKGVNFFK